MRRGRSRISDPIDAAFASGDEQHRESIYADRRTRININIKERSWRHATNPRRSRRNVVIGTQRLLLSQWIIASSHYLIIFARGLHVCLYHLGHSVMFALHDAMQDGMEKAGASLPVLVIPAHQAESLLYEGGSLEDQMKGKPMPHLKARGHWSLLSLLWRVVVHIRRITQHDNVPFFYFFCAPMFFWLLCVDFVAMTSILYFMFLSFDPFRRLIHSSNHSSVRSRVLGSIGVRISTPGTQKVMR